MEYITTKEASVKWGISTIRITVLANEGRIQGAKRLGRSWLIPANATKPQELKANHSGSPKKSTRKENDFFLPIYHFRPDWSYINETKLSANQALLLSAETAVLECRFLDAYHILESLLHVHDDISIEIGCLWNIGLCCICLNKPDDFSKYYLRLQILLAGNIPYRDNYTMILYSLSTYVDTMSSFSKYDVFSPDIHEQCLPLASILVGYKHLSQEIINPGSSDTTLLELNLRYLMNTGAVVAVEMMHCHLLGIYDLRQNTKAVENHAKNIIQLVYETKTYFPLVTYFHYFTQIFSPILEKYPEDFKNLIYTLSLEYEKNYNAFLTSINNFSAASFITRAEHPFIHAVLMDMPNTFIAKKLGISTRTLKRKLDIICEKLGVNNKKELKEFLHKNM